MINSYPPLSFLRYVALRSRPTAAARHNRLLCRLLFPFDAANGAKTATPSEKQQQRRKVSRLNAPAAQCARAARLHHWVLTPPRNDGIYFKLVHLFNFQ